MKNYRVGFKKGGNVTDVSAGPWNKKQKPKPGPKPGTGLKDLEKLKKRREAPKVKPDPYRHPYPREGREAPKVKPDPYRRGWGKPPQLRKSKKERREEYRKKAQKRGGNVIFADEWDKIDPGLQEGLFKKDGGRAGLKKGGPKPGTYDYFLLHKREKKKEGGRTGLKKGGPKPGTYDYFLLHKREKKAGGGTLLKQTVKKVAKKIKAKKDTESVKGVR